MLASCGEFHLTERRLLKYKGGQVHFLPINRITTLSSITTFVKPAIILGAILVGAGIMAKLFGVMADGLSASLGESIGGLVDYTPTNYSAVVDPIFLVLLVVGIIAIGVGIAFKRNWHQIKAAGLTKADNKVWQIPRDDSIETRNFTRMLETRIAGGGLERKVQTT